MVISSDIRIPKLNVSTLLKIYLFLNLYKPLIGIIIGRELITAFSIMISLGLFSFFLLSDIFKLKILKHKLLNAVLMFIFTLHFVFSLLILRTADIYPTIVSYFQVTTPILFLFVLDSLKNEEMMGLVKFLIRCLIPVIFFAFIEFLLPLNIRISIYMAFSLIVRGESSIDVAYYLGDTTYSGLRLGSLFFEPLTFAFVSTFLTIYLFSRKKRQAYIPFLANLLSLGKLPIATTLISIGSSFFRKVNRLYFVLIFLVITSVILYFAKNAEEIALENPSMGSHMLGLYYGVTNAMEAPFWGHGLGSAGYLSFLYYDKLNKDGPFRGLGGKMNGNESAVGVIAYQVGYILLIAFILFFIIYFKRLVKAQQIVMASGIIGYLLSLFLSESVLSVTVVSVLLIFSKSLIVLSENKVYLDN